MFSTFVKKNTLRAFKVLGVPTQKTFFKPKKMFMTAKGNHTISLEKYAIFSKSLLFLFHFTLFFPTMNSSMLTQIRKKYSSIK